MLQKDQGLREILENRKSIFYLLSDDEKQEIQHHVSYTKYRKNVFIFKEGEKPTGLLVLVYGKVKIFKEGWGGREQIIRMAKPLGIIGFRALLANEPHIASAVTIEECKICTISHDFVINYALRNSEFSYHIIQKLARELGFSNARTVTLTQKHIRGRLAESLILLKEKYGFEKDNITLRVYLSREDIASLSNMTSSNAIRTLATFAIEKVIAIDGRKIKILDVNRLERISKLG